MTPWAGTSRVYFLKASRFMACPVDMCRGRETIRANLWVHFVHINMRDTMVITEKANLPHPRCARCDMFVSWVYLNGRHPNTALCKKGEDSNWCCMAMDEAQSGVDTTFQAYVCPPTNISPLKYLSRLLTAKKNYYQKVVAKLQKAQRK